MEIQINHAKPMMMHIDLNSCFAMIEQQANPLLRGKPVGVAANMAPSGCVISPSYEAKARGVRISRVREAKELCPDIVILHSDPDKYFHGHKLFSRIFQDYSPDIQALSIDEAVINFAGTQIIKTKTLEEIGYEIKARVKAEVGDWLTCNVGIGPNRFLAKLAASLHKPDGLDVINADNLREVYYTVSLLDLCGINYRNEARLNKCGIYTPLEFLDAPLDVLKKQVFQSICGYYWYLRLRGWEIDDVQFGRKSYGQQYALHHFTFEQDILNGLMMKLCEKMGRRLRRSGNMAVSLNVNCSFQDRSWWHQSKTFPGSMYATAELYRRATELLEHRPPNKKVTHLGVSCSGLRPISSLPPTLFETEQAKDRRLADCMDKINNTYGEYVIGPASMMGLSDQIIKRVPFHATSDTLSEIYAGEETNVLV